MDPVSRTLSILATVLGCAAAQSDAPPAAEYRRTISGVVTDADGAPVAGAAVNLAGAIASPVWNEAPDMLHTTTDERGRWRVEGRECVEYTAWAAGQQRVSDAANGVVPGPRTELVLRHAAPGALRIDGLEPWRDHAPLRARLWLDGGSGHRVEMEIRDDRVTLPQDWPHASFAVEIVGADGGSIHVARQEPGLEAFTVAQPREIDVLVEDSRGQPLAGAEVFVEQLVHSRLAEIGSKRQRFEFVVGRSDENGRCRARIGTPWHGSEPDQALFLRARGSGHSDAFGGWDWQRRAFSEGLDADEGPDTPLTDDGALRLRLRAATRLGGRLTDGTVALAGCPIAVTARRTVHTRGAVGLHVTTSFVTQTDANGAFGFEGITAAEVQRVQVGSHPDIWGESRPAAPAPGQPLLAVPADAPAQEPDEALELDLADSTPVALQVLRPDGGPASNAVLVVLPLDADPAYLDADDPRYRLDPAGRTSLMLQRGVSWFAMVIDGTRVHVGEIRPGSTAERLTLTVAEIPRQRVRVQDPAGQPVAGARLSYSGYTYDEAPTAFGKQLTMLAAQLYMRWFERTRSDAQGWLEMPMLEESWTRFDVYVTDGTVQSAKWPLRLGDDPVEVTLPVTAGK